MTAARRSLGGVLCVLVLLAAACDGGAAEPAPIAIPTPTPSATATPTREAQGTLRIGIQEPVSILPATATAPSGQYVVDALFDSLTAWGPDAAAVPAAAVSWEADPEARVWTFTLREDATFHDGSPVRAEDFAFAWSLLVREDRLGYLLADVEGHAAVRDGQAERLAGLEAVDDRTLRVRLARPRGDFPVLAGHPALAPLSEAALRADPERFEVRPVGNGPFLAAEDWAHGQFVRVTRFPDWRNGPLPARVAEVVFQVLDADTAYLALQQGRIHVAGIPAGALANAVEVFGRASSPMGPGVHTPAAPSLYFLGFNPAVAPFDDLEVRRAVSLAIDRPRLAGQTLEGTGRAATGLVPPALDDELFRCAACRHDTRQARALFAERGITELTLWFNRGGGHERIAALLREDLAEAGVRLAYRTEEFPAFLDAVRSGEAGLYRFGWQADYPSVLNAVEPLVAAWAVPGATHGGASGTGGYNFARYADPVVDEALAAAALAVDPGVRRAAIQTVERTVLDGHQLFAPLITLRHRIAVRPEVAGLRIGPMGLADLERARLVTVRDGGP